VPLIVRSTLIQQRLKAVKRAKQPSFSIEKGNPHHSSFVILSLLANKNFTIRDTFLGDNNRNAEHNYKAKSE